MSLLTALRGWLHGRAPAQPGDPAQVSAPLAADGPYCEVAPWPLLSPAQVLGADAALARNAAAAWNSGRMVIGNVDADGHLHMRAVGAPEAPDDRP